MAGMAAGGGDTAGSQVFTTTTTAAMEEEDDQHGYFSSYTDLKVHEVMLRDWPRNSAYRRFFEDNAHLIQDKVVMDVGAGTGILSLFAASVGARKVYAVEASHTAHLCREIVRQNGLADRIEVVHSTVENADLKGAKVDVIVSEWMGFYLLHESMLDSVIVARDRFLAEDGIMVPSAARIYLAPVNMETYLEERLEFWTNVCGFDFSAAIPHVQRRLLQEPLTLELKDGQVMAAPQVLQEFDLKTVNVSQVQGLTQRLSFHTDSTTTIHGFAIWFDVDFRQGEQLASLRTQSSAAKSTNHSSAAKSTDHSSAAKSTDHSPAAKSTDHSSAVSVPAATSSSPQVDWKVVPDSVLSTSPARPVTHWKQTVVLLPRALSADPSEALTCQVTLTQSADNKRHYNIELELVDDEDDDDEDDDDDEEDDEDHPVPCGCGRGKCQLIRALMEKYGEEQDALEAEAELVDLTAEVEAAQAMGDEMDMGEDSTPSTSQGS